jgi:hypothetical protein
MFGIERFSWRLGSWNLAVYLVVCAVTFAAGSPEPLLIG